MAKAEALFVVDNGQGNINKFLLGVVPGRTVEGIKGKRRGVEYKRIVVEHLNRLRDAPSTSGLVNSPPPAPALLLHGSGSDTSSPPYSAHTSPSCTPFERTSDPDETIGGHHGLLH